MKRRFWLAFALASVVLGQSQPPAPSPSKPAQDQQDHKPTKGDKAYVASGTVTTAPVPALPKQESGKNTNNGSDNSPSNWWLIIPTIAIAIATAVQVFIYRRQAKYMRQGLNTAITQTRTAIRTTRAAKESAEAAKASIGISARMFNSMSEQTNLLRQSVEAAREGAEAAFMGAKATLKSVEALINSERAWITITRVYYLYPKSGFNEFSFDIKNQGRTVARLMDFRGTYTLLGAVDTLPVEPIYPSGPLRQGDFDGGEFGRVLVPGDELRGLPIVYGLMFSDQEVEGLLEGKFKWFVHGCIGYIDVSEKRRELHFCYRFTPNANMHTEQWGSFILDDQGNRHYNKHT